MEEVFKQFSTSLLVPVKCLGSSLRLFCSFCFSVKIKKYYDPFRTLAKGNFHTDFVSKENP